MINTNTTKLHKNSDGNSHPQASPANVTALKMPEGFRQEQTPEGAQGQVGREVAQPRDGGIIPGFLSFFGLAKHKQDRAPQGLVAEEPVMVPVAQVPEVEPQKPRLTAEEQRASLNHKIVGLEAKLKEEVEVKQTLDAEYRDLMKIMVPLKVSTVPADVMQYQLKSIELAALVAKQKKNEMQIAMATASIANVQRQLAALPQPKTEIEKLTEEVLESQKQTEQIIEQNASVSSDPGKLLDEVRKGTVLPTTAVSLQPVNTSFDEATERNVTDANQLVEAFIRQMQAEKSEGSLEEAGGSQQLVATL